jgi:predicted AAA+ superfamily ATPase
VGVFLFALVLQQEVPSLLWSDQAAMKVDPSLLQEGPVPRLLDEWQLAPAIWNQVRRAVDDRRAPGCFILTGSAVPADDAMRHTGAGRIVRLRMRPMSLFELGHADGSVPLGQLLVGEPARAADPGLGVADLAELICVGGWPGQQRGIQASLRANHGYLDDVRRTDVRRVDGRARDPERVGRLLRAYARNVATTASARTLAADAADDGNPLDRDVARDYIDALARLMVVEDQPAWAPHLRSKSIARGAVRRHLADPSLAAAALAATPARMLNNLNLMGFMFESLAVRDLRVYAQAHAGTVYHYRDNTGLEVDAIVELADGTWAAFEIKLGQGYVDDALSFGRVVGGGRAGTLESGPGGIRTPVCAVLPRVKVLFVLDVSCRLAYPAATVWPWSTTRFQGERLSGFWRGCQSRAPFASWGHGSRARAPSRASSWRVVSTLNTSPWIMPKPAKRRTRIQTASWRDSAGEPSSTRCSGCPTCCCRSRHVWIRETIVASFC